MKISIGRTVHYTATIPDAEHGTGAPDQFAVQAAIVTGTNIDGSVALTVFQRGALPRPVDGVMEAPTGFVAGSPEAVNRWSWPAVEK